MSRLSSLEHGRDRWGGSSLRRVREREVQLLPRSSGQLLDPVGAVLGELELIEQARHRMLALLVFQTVGAGKQLEVLIDRQLFPQHRHLRAVTEPLGTPTDSRTRRFVKVARWIVGIAVVWLILGFLGIDLSGWISDLWDQIVEIWNSNPGYFLGALVLQTGQTIFAGASYYFIL